MVATIDSRGVLAIDRATIWPGGLFVMIPPPILFDATRSEQHGVQFAVAQQPLEDGSIVTDHVQELPEVVTFEVVLTDYPAWPTLPTAPLGTDRYMQLWRALKAFVRTRQPFDFSCSLDVYRQVVAERLSAPRTADTGKSVVCTLVLRRVEISTVDEAQVLADAAVAGSLSEQDLGEVDFAIAGGGLP